MSYQTKVLIVEDSPATTELLLRILQFLNPTLDVFIAANGEDGLTYAWRHKPSLIISDLDMPGMNGVEMVRILRQEKGTAQIPVIGMSNNDPGGADVTTFRLLCDAFLDKPFTMVELQEKITKLLSPPSETKKSSRGPKFTLYSAMGIVM